MGAQTVRYMQFLLSIDYFEQNSYFDANPHLKIQSTIGKEVNFDYSLKKQKKVDKSNWVASVTALNGCMNGSLGPYCLDLDKDSLRFEASNTRFSERSSWLSRTFHFLIQLLCVLDNLNSPGQTSANISERVIKKIKLNYRGFKQTVI
jgi:hypothetical protein